MLSGTLRKSRAPEGSRRLPLILKRALSVSPVPETRVKVPSSGVPSVEPERVATRPEEPTEEKKRVS